MPKSSKRIKQRYNAKTYCNLNYINGDNNSIIQGDNNKVTLNQEHNKKTGIREVIVNIFEMILKIIK